MKCKLTEKRFIELAEKGQIKVRALLRDLRKGGRHTRENMGMVECTIGRYWQADYSYKVHLIHKEGGFEHRDIYTRTLIDFINDGTFEAIIEEVQ